MKDQDSFWLDDAVSIHLKMKGSKHHLQMCLCVWSHPVIDPVWTKHGCFLTTALCFEDQPYYHWYNVAFFLLINMLSQTHRTVFPMIKCPHTSYASVVVSAFTLLFTATPENISVLPACSLLKLPKFFTDIFHNKLQRNSIMWKEIKPRKPLGESRHMQGSSKAAQFISIIIIFSATELIAYIKWLRCWCFRLIKVSWSF